MISLRLRVFPLIRTISASRLLPVSNIYTSSSLGKVHKTEKKKVTSTASRSKLWHSGITSNSSFGNDRYEWVCEGSIEGNDWNGDYSGRGTDKTLFASGIPWFCLEESIILGRFTCLREHYRQIGEGRCKDAMLFLNKAHFRSTKCRCLDVFRWKMLKWWWSISRTTLQPSNRQKLPYRYSFPLIR